ncbi:MAG: efflux RND transporter permease subunit [Amphritea sp.]|nr:efflux RND transporter permease subunit [Amphritea sp.]
MKQLLTHIIGRRMTANVLTLAVVLLGIYAVIRLPLAEYPVIDFGSASIETSYPGASAEDVEANVTSRIEKELLTLSDIKTFTSTSEDGFSSIRVQLKDDVKDVPRAMQDIRDAVSRVSDLPAGVTESPRVRVTKSSSLDFMIVGVSGDIPYAQLRQHARALELELRRLPGIGNVLPNDLREKEFWIEVDQAQLSRYGLTLDDVATAVTERNVLMTGGSLESYQSAQDLITLSELKSLDALREVQISRSPVIRLDDVSGQISESFERPGSYASINGEQVIAFDLRTSDAVDVTATATAVRELLAREQLKAGDRVEYRVGFDLSVEIQSKFDVVKNNGIVGLVLVIITLALMLNRNIALWVAMGIPFSLLGVFALLAPLGQVLDSYTLAAMILIIGIIVDDAVVVSEKIVHRCESGEPVNSAILNGLKDILPAVLTSMITTFLAFLPLMFLPGNTGKMLYVMPMTVGLALLFSLIDVVIVLPSHLRPILERKRTGKPLQRKAVAESRFRSLYLRTVTRAVRYRYITIPLLAVLIIGSGGLSLQQLNYIFYPTQGAYLIEVEAEVDSSANIDDAWRYSRALEQIIAAEGEHVARWYGSVGAPYSSFLISLVPSNDRDVSADAIVEKWQAQADELEGFVDVEFEVDAGGPPKGRPVDIMVVGGENADRERMATDLTHWLQQRTGVKKVFRATDDERPVIVADIDYERLNRYGISVLELARTLRLSVDGERISRVFAGDEEVHYRLLLQHDDRNLNTLENLELRAADGQMVKARDLVQWRESETAAAIKHYNGERSIRVSGMIDQALTDPLAVEAQIWEQFPISEYNGVRLVSNGKAKETREALHGLLTALAVALVAILLALILLFDSIWESLIIMSIVPFGLAACATVLHLHGEPLSFFALVGAIGLVGVMVNNSLVLVCHYQQQLETAIPDNIEAFAVEGSLARLRAVSLTTVTTVAGLIPLAYGLGGYDNYMGPIALVMGWGIMVAAVVTLVFVPCVYSVYLKARLRKQSKTAELMSETA